MTVMDAIKKRYSCRSYKSIPIEHQKLEKIYQAARLAPSAKNLQDWRFVFVTDKELKKKLVKAANDQSFLEKAAVIIAACSNCPDTMTCGQALGPIDVAIALEHIALQAAELELATCWIGSFFPDQVRKILQIPSEIGVIELMALGYPADKAPEPDRVGVEEIISLNKWNF